MTTPILGDDGKLRSTIDFVQPNEDSISMVLSKVFLIDPANEAFIAGKKKKRTQHKSSSAGTTASNGKETTLFFSYLFLITFVGAQIIYMDGFLAVEMLAFLLAGSYGFVFALYLLACILDWPNRQAQWQAERYLFSYGKLLKGEVIAYHRRIYNPTSTDFSQPREKSEILSGEKCQYRDHDALEFCFTTPDGHQIARVEYLQRREDLERPIDPIR